MNIILYFGSFNPVHIGHTALANYVVETLNYNELWFVVSPHNPLKKSIDLAPVKNRVEMLKISINDYSKFKVCDVELNMPTPSYTYKSLKKITELYPDYKFTVLMGSDSYLNLNKWVNYKDIINNYAIIVYPRPGYILKANDLYNYNHKIVEAPVFDISSSLIRNNLNKKLDIRFLMPDNIFNYIKKNNLYL